MTLATDLLSQAKLHIRVSHDDEDADILLMLNAAIGDVAHASNWPMPGAAADLPEDLVFAVCDQAAMLYDWRAGNTDRPAGLSLAAKTICARYRGVSLGALE